MVEASEVLTLLLDGCWLLLATGFEVEAAEEPEEA